MSPIPAKSGRSMPLTGYARMRGPRVRAMVRKLVRRPRGLAFWVILVVGLLTVAGLALYAALLIQSLMRDFSHKHLVALLFGWQTQAGAAFAVAAALIGGAAVVYQAEDARRAQEEMRQRRAMAARAMLPHALVEVTGYAEECAATYVPLLGLQVSAVVTTPLDFPPFPAGAAEALGRAIEVVTSDEAGPIATLVDELQIIRTRLRDNAAASARAGRGVLLRANIPGCLVDLAVLYARCEGLLTYARGRADAPARATAPDDVRQAVMLMPIPNSEEVEEEIAGRAADGNWPRQSYARPSRV